MTSGMVCSADRLASEAGVAMLRRGGNAVDAALATNAVLAVTAPHLCGMGGDLFALVYDGQVHALNASGRAGAGSSAEQLRSEGHTRMPVTGDLRAVTVPGCVDGWMALHERARLPLDVLFEPAEALASKGFRPSPLLEPRLPTVPLEREGDLVVRLGVARTLHAIADQGRDGFYAGEFGQGLLELGAGLYAEADLARPLADWVTPLRQRVFGHDVWTAPPNSQGYLLLLSLAVVQGLDLPDDPDDPLWAHLLVESARVAGYDRPDVLHEHATPPGDVDRRRAMVRPDARAEVRSPGAAGGTTYLCTVDGEGMGVSLIQSNALGFGSLLWEPRTGINLQNRGLGFSLRPGHPAELAPGKRPPHTLVPGLVTRPDGSLRSVVGSMGGDAQPQIMLQLLVRLLRHEQPPDDVIATPRWRLAARKDHRAGHGATSDRGADERQGRAMAAERSGLEAGRAATGFDTWDSEETVQIEEGAPWAEGLAARGQPVEPAPYSGAFGHAHLIDVHPDGSLDGAADPRAVIGAAIAQE